MVAINRKMQIALDPINGTKSTLVAGHNDIKLIADAKNAKTEGLRQFDEKNSDLKEVLNDTREKINIWIAIILLVLTFAVDLAMFNEPITILVSDPIIALAATILLPLFIGIAEVGASHFASQQVRTGHWSKLQANALKSFVFSFLFAATVLGLGYAYNCYDQNTDGPQFIYLLQHFAVKILLLIFSGMLHLILIAFSEMVVFAIAFLRYLHKRGKMSKQESGLDRKLKKLILRFKKYCTLLDRQINQFKQTFGDTGIDFRVGVPADVIDAINACMGKEVLSHNAPVSYRYNKNIR